MRRPLRLVVLSSSLAASVLAACAPSEPPTRPEPPDETLPDAEAAPTPGSGLGGTGGGGRGGGGGTRPAVDAAADLAPAGGSTGEADAGGASDSGRPEAAAASDGRPGAGSPDAAASGGPDGAITGEGAFGLGGASRCGGGGLKYCESFEEASTLKERGWSVNAVTVDELRPARGKKALHIKAASANRPYGITRPVAEISQANGNVLYTRMFVWFEDALTSGGHFGLAEGAGLGGTNARFGGQFNAFGVGNDGGPTGDWTDNDGIRVKDKVWTCLEFMFDGAKHEFRVWVDDVERPKLRSGANRHPGYRMPRLDRMWIGWFLYFQLEPQELWIDEIAIHTERIGCTK